MSEVIFNVEEDESGGYRLTRVNWRTNIDIDDEACAAVMRRSHLKTKRDAVSRL